MKSMAQIYTLDMKALIKHGGGIRLLVKSYDDLLKVRKRRGASVTSRLTRSALLSMRYRNRTSTETLFKVVSAILYAGRTVDLNVLVHIEKVAEQAERYIQSDKERKNE